MPSCPTSVVGSQRPRSLILSTADGSDGILQKICRYQTPATTAFSGGRVTKESGISSFLSSMATIANPAIDIPGDSAGHCLAHDSQKEPWLHSRVAPLRTELRERILAHAREV